MFLAQKSLKVFILAVQLCLLENFSQGSTCNSSNSTCSVSCFFVFIDLQIPFAQIFPSDFDLEYV